ncbi:hypothetical protein ACIQU5_27935 [Streptomyces sp. NPDC090306]|uniref:hypothetical protein n=1 Tax=Streptomyces sp. NPDC090306 TaxID=3365961 RepID=UPI00381305D1
MSESTTRLPDLDNIRFDAPAPEVRRDDQALRDFAATLRAKPGEWALLGRDTNGNCARQKAYDLRRGALPQFRDGRYEAETHTMFGEPRVYVRYVGGEAR